MIAWTLISLAGCSASAPVATTPVTKQPFRGQEVVLLVPKSLNLSAVWEILIQEWSSQSGATARFVEYETSADLKNEDTLKRELQQEDTLKGGLEQPVESGGTLVLFPFNRFRDLPRNLSPLTVREGEFDAKDIFKGLRERVLTREQKLLSNPVSVPVLSCYYRRDLLRAAHKTAPETWEDYDELVASVGQWAPELIATEPLGPEFRATTFFARSLAYCKHPENYSVWFDLETGQPTIDTPGFERALAMAAQTWTRLPVESRSHTAAECRNLILTGKAAITLAFEPSDAELTSRTLADNAAKIERAEGIEIGVCRIPGTRTVYNRNSKKWDPISAKSIHAPALCGFAGLASAVIVPGVTKVDCAAMNLLATLSTADVFDRAFSSLPKSACRESQLSFAPAWYGPELATEEASMYCDAVAESLRDSQLVYELPVMGSIEFRRAAAMALDPLLRGESDPKQTLVTMQKLFAEIVERLGPVAVRDSHRKGLGLSPVQKR